MAFGLCKYKNAFGIQGQGIHSYRLGKGLIGKNGIAILDVLVTLAGAYLLSYLLDQPFWLICIIIFPLGIIIHRLFCVRTAVDVLLFPGGKDHD
jgi:hypothetical protein